MKLRDLIEELGRHDPDLDVRFLFDMGAVQSEECTVRRRADRLNSGDRVFLAIELE